MEELEDFFENIDVTEPGALEQVLLVREKKREEDEAYIKLLVEKIHGREITWPRPWYQQGQSLTRKTRAPRDAEEPYRVGALTLEERKKVENNWEQFVREFEVPDTPGVLARWKNMARGMVKSTEELARYFVVVYLARGLSRDLHQVNRYFLNTYRYSTKLRNYTPTEEKAMDICFTQSPEDAVLILSEVLGREPRGLQKRLDQFYDGKPGKKRLEWTLKLSTKLVKHLMAFCECSLEELKNKFIKMKVWKQCEKAMCQKYYFLRQHWYGKLHVQLFAKCGIKSTPLRKIICNKLKKTPYKIWSDIRWKKIVLGFPDGFTHAYLYKMTKTLFETIPGYATKPLREVISKALSKKKYWRRRSTKSLELDIKGNLKVINHKKRLWQVQKILPIVPGQKMLYYL